METVTIYFTGAVCALCIGWLVTMLAGHWLTLADRLRQLLAATALDVVQLQRSAAQARLDVETQQARLELGQEVAQLHLAEQRLQLKEGE